MRKTFLLLAVLALVVGLNLAQAQVASSTFRVGGVGLITCTADVTTASVLATDAGTVAGLSKRAQVQKWVVNGQDVFVLVRVQRSSGGTFVDLVADSSLANLLTRVDAMNLAGVNHPAPTKDAVDAEAITAAGG